MRADLEKRRKEMWERLVVYGELRSEVESSLADKYDLKVETVSNDIDKMASWLPKLAEMGGDDGTSQLRELRRNRHRLHELADQAKEDEDLEAELKIRLRIDQSVERDVKLCQELRAEDEATSEGDEMTAERDPSSSDTPHDGRAHEQQDEKPTFRDHHNDR